ncbi:MAG TPA: dihydroorotate dehydrogenase-like protein [Aggregatilineales bacterium]|nr:dihydroorotate dehydrogenase-like protein [Aggregatilineales bacterium]
MMTNIETTYMGIPLKSPIVVAASSLSNMIDRVQRCENSGAGAIVIRSLFEEQIKLEQAAVGSGARKFDPVHIEQARVYFPLLNEDAARSHLMWVKKTRDVVQLPIIASLNAATLGTWTLYASELEHTGINGLELNVYSIAASIVKSGAKVEKELFGIVKAVREEVSIPVSVKLSPFYTSVAHVAHELHEIGINGLVLFNRFLQPDVNLDGLNLRNEHYFSTSSEMRLPLRWIAILYDRVQADLAHSTGVHSGLDAVKTILAGAQVVQVAAALFLNGIEYLEKMNDEIHKWMQEYEFQTLKDFRGILSQKQVSDPSPLERAQYVQMLVDEH